MKSLLLSILLFTVTLSLGQYTDIPDVNFEQALIDLSYDDLLDGQVLTENIATVTELDISNRGIQNLTGIEDFLALEVLDCSINKLFQVNVSNNSELRILFLAVNNLMSLDVTQNSKLEYLRIHDNQLSELNVSQNPFLNYLNFDNNELSEINISNNLNLEILMCSNNQIEELELSQNPNLTIVICDYNQISQIDISSNPSIYLLLCSHNQLTSLNIKNRNNYEVFDFESTSSPNLFCVDVDNVEWANTHWRDPNHTDPWVNFSLDCANMSTQDENLSEIRIFPNPTKNFLNFSENLKEITIYDLSGKSILKGKGIQINVSNIPNGTYLLKGKNNSGKTISQKFIKN